MIIQFPINDDVIDISKVKDNSRLLRAGLIEPASEEVEEISIKEHSAEPIRDVKDIERISEYLIQMERYRDNMLFIVGINFGLRVSDLRILRFSNIIDESFRFKDRFAILEKKTSNTRKVKKNRYISINDAVIEAVTLYLENTEGVRLSDYMFRSESNHGCNVNEPIHRNSIDRILKGIADELELGIRMSTHTLRKTFCFHQMMMSGNDPRKLLLLQKMLGHSTSAQTLDYIGLTEDEMCEAYQKMNLGGSGCYMNCGEIMEADAM